MPRREEEKIKARLSFPTGGISDFTSFVEQPGDLCPPDAIRNCIPFDTDLHRQRGGKRPGLKIAFPGFQAVDADGNPTFIQSMVSLALASRVSGVTTGAEVNLIAQGGTSTGGGTAFTSVLEDGDTWFIDNQNTAGSLESPPPIYASESLDNLFDTWYGRYLGRTTPGVSCDAFNSGTLDPNAYTPGATTLSVGVNRNFGGIRARWATRSTATYSSGLKSDSDTVRIVNNISFRERRETVTTYDYAQGRFVVTIMDRSGNPVRSWMIFDAKLSASINATTTTKASGIPGTLALSGLHHATLDGATQDRPWHLICNDIDVGPTWTYFALTAFQSDATITRASTGSAHADDDAATVRARSSGITSNANGTGYVIAPKGSPYCRGWVLAIKNTALVDDSAATIGASSYVLTRVVRGVTGLTGPSAHAPTATNTSTVPDLASECVAVRYRGFEALTVDGALDVENPRLTENYRPRWSHYLTEVQPYLQLGTPWRTGGTPVLRERSWNMPAPNGAYSGIPRVSFGGRASEVAGDANQFFVTIPASSSAAAGPAITLFGPQLIVTPTSLSATAYSSAVFYQRSSSFRNSPLRYDAQDHLGYRMHFGPSVTKSGLRSQYVIDNPTATTGYRTTPPAPAGRNLPWYAITGVTPDNSIGKKVNLAGGTEREARDGDINPDVVVAFAGQYDFQSGIARYSPDLSEKWRLGEMPTPHNPGHGPIHANGQSTSPTLALPLLTGTSNGGQLMQVVRGTTTSDFVAVQNSGHDFLLDKDHATCRFSVLWAPLDTRFDSARSGLVNGIADARAANPAQQRSGLNNYNRDAKGCFPTCMDVDPWGMIYVGTTRRGCGYGIPLLNPPPNDWGSITNTTTSNDITNRLPAASGIYKTDDQLASSTNAVGYGNAYPDATLKNTYAGTPRRRTISAYSGGASTPTSSAGTATRHYDNAAIMVDEMADYGNVPNGQQTGHNVFSITPDGFALQALIAAPAAGTLPYQYPDGAVFPAGASVGIQTESEVTQAAVTDARKYLAVQGDRFIPMVRSIAWWPRPDDPNNTSLAICTRFASGSNVWISQAANGDQLTAGVSSSMTFESAGVPGLGLSLGQVIRAERVSLGWPEWRSGKAYAIGDSVSVPGAYYVCKVAHTSGTSHAPPPGNTTDWELASAGNPTKTTDLQSAVRYQPKNLMPFIFGSKTRGGVPIGPLTKITSSTNRENILLGKFELYMNEAVAFYGEPAVVVCGERFDPKNTNDFAWSASQAYLAGDLVSYGSHLWKAAAAVGPTATTPADPDWKDLGALSGMYLESPAGVDSYAGLEIRRSSRPVVYKIVCATRSFKDGYAKGVFASTMGISIDTRRDPLQAVGSSPRTPGSYLALTTPEANRSANASFSTSNDGTAPGPAENGAGTGASSTSDGDLSGTAGNGNAASGAPKPGFGGDGSGGGGSGGSNPGGIFS